MIASVREWCEEERRDESGEEIVLFDRASKCGESEIPPSEVAEAQV